MPGFEGNQDGGFWRRDRHRRSDAARLLGFAGFVLPAFCVPEVAPRSFAGLLRVLSATISAAALSSFTSRRRRERRVLDRQWLRSRRHKFHLIVG